LKFFIINHIFIFYPNLGSCLHKCTSQYGAASRIHLDMIYYFKLYMCVYVVEQGFWGFWDISYTGWPS